MTTKPKALIIDQARVVGLIRSTAYIVSANQFTNIKIVEGQNFIEKAFNGLTGNVLMEIEVDDQKITEACQQRIKLFVKRLIESAKSGPKKMIEYLQELENTKVKFNQFLQEKYNEVSRNNQELINDLEKAIKITAMVKAGSTIAVSVLGLFTPAGSVVGLVQSMGMEVAKNIGEAKNADIIFLKKTAIDTGKSGIVPSIEIAVDQAFQALSRWAFSEQGKIYKSLRTDMTVTASEAYKNVKTLKPGLQWTKQGSRITASGLSIIFAAISVAGAIDEYKTTISNL